MCVRIIGVVGKVPQPLLLAVDVPEGWTRPVRHRDVHVLFDDGGWRLAKVLGWLHDDRRGWQVQLQWRGGRTEWRLYDRRYIHPV
jgi:hypothetical protein